MSQGRIARWYKSEGETIEKDDPLYEIETEKVTSLVESPQSGVVLKIIYPEGSVVPCFEPIAVIGETGEPLPREAEQAIQRAHKTSAAPLPVPVQPASSRSVEVVASPSARRLAREKGIDITKVKGTGSGGRISSEDVQTEIDAARLPTTVKSFALEGIRKNIAERMSKSYREAPHVTLFVEMDMTESKQLVTDLEKRIDEGGIRITYTDVIIKAVAKTLKEVPGMNAVFDGGSVKVFDEANVGLAVATEDGLIVPVIKGADTKTLTQVAGERHSLAGKARAGNLKPEDVVDGTFTVTNLGMFGVDAFTPIINPPQVGILGVGRVREKPTVVQGQVVGRDMADFSLSFDHRVMDGAKGAQFLVRLKENLEQLNWLRSGS